MLLLAAYIWIARPSRKVGSPLPAMVFNPSIKSTSLEESGMSRGCQASWVGEVCTLGLIGRKLDSNCLTVRIWSVSQDGTESDTHVGIIWEPSETLVRYGRTDTVKPTRQKEIWEKRRDQECSILRIQILGPRRYEGCTGHLNRSIVRPRARSKQVIRPTPSV